MTAGMREGDASHRERAKTHLPVASALTSQAQALPSRRQIERAMREWNAYCARLNRELARR